MKKTIQLFFVIILTVLLSESKAQVTEQDSSALVSFYNTTDGANWTDNTNWLNGQVSTWAGITVIDGSVYTIELPSNNLTGNIPTNIGNLTGLRNIILNDNQLTGEIPTEIGLLTELSVLILTNNQMTGSIPSEIANLNMTNLSLGSNNFGGSVPSAIGTWEVLYNLHLNDNQFTDLPSLSSLPEGTVVRVENNRFEFDDLEPNINILTSYSPQDSIGVASEESLNKGDQLMLTITTGGAQNSYKWFKNNTEIIGQENAALTISNTVLLDAGVYHAEVKNRLLRNLTLIGRPTKVNIDDPGLIADSLALVQLLVSTGGFQWNNATNWLEGPVSTWYGVTVTNGRVSQLDLSNNNLTGSIPLEILKMSKLTFLSLENNKIKNLPNLSNLPLTGLSVENNKLEFDDIEPNISIPLFTYWPQDSIGVAQELNLSVFAELSLSITAGGTMNRYKWFKNGNLIPNLISGIHEASIRYPVVLPSNAGVYHAEVSNLLVPNLILLGRSTSVKIQNPVVTADSLALVAFYNATDGPNWKNNSNWLNGPVSTWYGVEVEPYFRRVGVLKLPRNFLKGTIPPEIGQLEELQYLNLSVNDLTGAIPRGILQLWRLRIFNVKENRLSGFSANLPKSGVVNNIPPEIGNLTELELLDLGSNLFTGVLPPEIGKLTKLKVLNLGINQLSGSLPLEIGDLTSLDTLNLGSNNFTGELPLSMVNLTNLAFFNMDSTQLEVPNDSSFQNWFGNIPEVVTKVEELKSKSGTIPNEFALEQNYPNPFNPTTTIQYAIPNVASGFNMSKVQLKIYDPLGSEVATLVNENQSAGNYEVKFNASDLTSGIYFYRLQAGSFIEIKKMLLMK